MIESITRLQPGEGHVKAYDAFGQLVVLLPPLQAYRLMETLHILIPRKEAEPPVHEIFLDDGEGYGSASTSSIRSIGAGRAHIFPADDLQMCSGWGGGQFLRPSGTPYNYGGNLDGSLG